MTGWRIGWAQSSEATIKTMTKAVEFMTSNPATMVQQAGLIALRDGEPYIRELRAHYSQRRAQASAISWFLFASETYYRRFRGHQEPSKGKGVRLYFKPLWEEDLLATESPSWG